MNDVDRRRRAAVLLILAWTLALHAWIPALLAITFVSWAILHKWLESDFGDGLIRRWRPNWPPGRLVLILLLVTSALLVWESGERPLAKVLPVTLAILGLSTILLGGWLTPASPDERYVVAGGRQRRAKWPATIARSAPR